MQKTQTLFLISFMLLLSSCSQAVEAQIENILHASEPPVGVVFELASTDDDGLDWAIPRVRAYAKQLRAKFPNIKLAVVSHGLEQFQLTRESSAENAAVQEQVQSLINDEHIELHVCGNFASMMGHGRDDFVDFVKVAGRAPLQVKELQQAGYALVLITDP